MMARGSFEMNLVEPDVGSDVFESVRPKIAEQPHFAFAFFRFANGDQVDPAVVVVVERGDAEGADPIGFWKFDLLEVLAVVVAPERKAGCPSCVKARSIQPS